jgi:hypothetical protein
VAAVVTLLPYTQNLVCVVCRRAVAAPPPRWRPRLPWHWRCRCWRAGVGHGQFGVVHAPPAAAVAAAAAHGLGEEPRVVRRAVRRIENECGPAGRKSMPLCVSISCRAALANLCGVTFAARWRLTRRRPQM